MSCLRLKSVQRFFDPRNNGVRKLQTKYRIRIYAYRDTYKLYTINNVFCIMRVCCYRRVWLVIVWAPRWCASTMTWLKISLLFRNQEKSLILFLPIDRFVDSSLLGRLRNICEWEKKLNILIIKIMLHIFFNRSNQKITKLTIN